MIVNVPRVVVAGTASGVGKTTVATGLMAALSAAGHRVAGFKVGPDFIDPGYHTAATGRPGRNLDAFLSGQGRIAPLFAHGAAGADVAVVEGVMGLFDGVRGTDGEASTAHVARLLDAPVVLVVDAAAMARSVAAVVHGYATFDARVRVAGVVVNNVGSPGHAELVRDALAALPVPVLGVLRRDRSLAAPERHLGLVPVDERPAETRRILVALGERVAAAVDLHAVLRLARSAPPLHTAAWSADAAEAAGGAGRARARIAVAGGAAFSFRYQENLELLAAAGADLAAFDPLTDTGLPDGTQGLYLGGGFPEAYAQALSANSPLRAAVAAFAAAGRPVLAECGGLLYLCADLDGQPLCGVLPARATMTGRLTLGYRRATAGADSAAFRAGEAVRGHEFHYSAVRPAASSPPAWRIDGRDEGFAAPGVHASYLHTHWAATPSVATRFVGAAAAAEVAA